VTVALAGKGKRNGSAHVRWRKAASIACSAYVRSGGHLQNMARNTPPLAVIKL